jgi:hypothetical protein
MGFFGQHQIFTSITDEFHIPKLFRLFGFVVSDQKSLFHFAKLAEVEF